MDFDYTILKNIYDTLQTISFFTQIFFYGIVLLILIYFGYWFFSRFFY